MPHLTSCTTIGHSYTRYKGLVSQYMIWEADLSSIRRFDAISYDVTASVKLDTAQLPEPSTRKRYNVQVEFLAGKLVPGVHDNLALLSPLFEDSIDSCHRVAVRLNTFLLRHASATCELHKDADVDTSLDVWMAGRASASTFKSERTVVPTDSSSDGTDERGAQAALSVETPKTPSILDTEAKADALRGAEPPQRAPPQATAHSEATSTGTSEPAAGRTQ